MSTVKTAVGRFVWHDHLSGDPEAAKRFYAELLGWDYDVWQAGSCDYPMIKVNDQTHGGFGLRRAGHRRTGSVHIPVDDVDQAADARQGRRRVDHRRPDGHPRGRAHGRHRRSAGRRRVALRLGWRPADLRGRLRLATSS